MKESSRVGDYFNTEETMIRTTAVSKKRSSFFKKTITGEYHSHKFIITSFLLCKHKKLSEMKDAFWALLNPYQTKWVSYRKIEAFLEFLQHVAIDVPRIAEEDAEDSTRTLVVYLKNCTYAKQKAIAKTKQQLVRAMDAESSNNQAQVSKHAAVEVLSEHWFKAHTIRNFHITIYHQD